MTSSTHGFVLMLAVFASSLAGCAVQSAPDSNDPTAALDSEKGAEGKVSPEGIFGPPTLSASLIQGNAVAFKGTEFTSGGTVSVGLYSSANNQWTLQSGTELITASSTTCSKTFCIFGGAISGSIPWTKGCNPAVSVRAYDYSSRTWVTGPIPICEHP